MALIAESRRNAFWFGTEEKMTWMPTPNRGAQTGGSGWSAEGTTLNGGGFQLNSFGSHRQYIFEWPSTSSAKMAQLMKSYADGSFGRGLIYFIDPLIYTTNVLPAMWADPSMGIGQEGASLVYGVEATGLPTSGHEANSLPVASAYYDLTGVSSGWRGKEDAVFIPIPDGYTLSLGSIHSQSGQGRVMYRTQSRNGGLGPVSSVTPLPTSTSTLVNTFISGPDVAGAWLFVGKAGAGAGSVTLTAMTGRLIPTVKAVVAPVATNLFTNPRLVGDGTWAEVRRNLHPRPDLSSGTSGWTITPGATNSPVPGGMSFTATRNLSLEYVAAASHFAAAAVTAGQVVSLGFSVRNTSATSIKMYAAAYPSDGTATVGTVANGDTVTIPAGDTRIVKVEGVTVPVGASVMRPVLFTPSGGVDSGSTWVVEDGVTVMVSPLLTALFSGSTPDFTVDPDMRTRWLGTPNASESVMEIEKVAGVSFVSSSGVFGVSRQRPGAGRLIKIGALVPFAQWVVPVALRTGGMTATAQLELNAPMAAEPSGNIASIYAIEPLSRTNGTNTTEPQDLRWTRGDFTSTYNFRVYGTNQADVDTYWSNIGWYAGDYDGPVFNGSSGTIMIGSQLATTEWDGTPDNSTSTAYSTSKELIDIRKGPWIGGQGHSGCRFIGKPTEIKYGPFNGGQVGFAASFREVGSWLYG